MSAFDPLQTLGRKIISGELGGVMAEQRLRSSGVAMLGLALLALAIAPAVAPPITFLLLTFSPGDPSQVRHLAFSPFVLLTFHGMLGYGLAFAACAVLGLPLSFAARSTQSLVGSGSGWR
jgi:hypothetical protein